MDGHQIRVPHGRKSYENFPLKKLVPDVFLDPADIQASRKFMFVRLFSMRKRISLYPKDMD
mgnify:CR=1 FL=1